MSAICNGIALYGGLIPFDATFLTFSDYSRAALRLGAIQKVGVIHEFTHDSFYLGEDGPTHQAIEHVMSLRLIPDFFVMRPADAREKEVMMREAVRLRKNPTAICLSRQKLPTLALSDDQKRDCAKGGYILHAGKQPKFIIFATGSEISLALEVADKLGKDSVRIVSLPCWELFDRQSAEYRAKVTSPEIANRISIEAGVTLGWQRFVGENGLMIGVDHFGDSAPAEVLAKEYGFTADAVCEKVKQHFR
jgi:transketolase